MRRYRPLISIAGLRSAVWHLRAGGVKQLRLWLDRSQYELGIVTPRNVKGVEGFWSSKRGVRTLSFPAFQAGAITPKRNLRVGIVADPFTITAFEPEAHLHQLPSEASRSYLNELGLDLILVESAWKGNDGSWTGKIAGSHGSDSPLRSLVTTAQSLGIPAIFWNKEDPVHFDDFIEAAELFDVVFTSDLNRIPDYLARLPHKNVHALPFAIQPQVHNPIRPKRGYHARGIMFAGMYFRDKYPRRRQWMELLLCTSEKFGTGGPEIFARHAGLDEKYKFPEPFQSHVVGELDYPRMLSAYRAYKVILNVNTVEDSPTMCSRRALEAVACGSTVVSSPAQGIDHLLGGHLKTVSDQDQTVQAIGAGLQENNHSTSVSMHRARRELWRNHTYSHRLDTILSAAGVSSALPDHDPSVTVLLVTMRPWQVEFALNQLDRQKISPFQIVILGHGFDVDRSLIDRHRANRDSFAEIVALMQPKSTSLGACLNIAIDHADGDVLTKFDDDDFYGPEYLADFLDARRFSGSQLLGKQSHFVKSSDQEGLALMYPAQENSYTRLVMGPTLTGDREVFERIRFADRSLGEDTDFQKRASQEGIAIFSADRFNYVMNRRDSGHTWQMETDRLTNRSTFFPDLSIGEVLDV